MEKLNTINGKSLLALDIAPPKYIVSRILPTGLHLLAGSPKIGKSWLALWLCDRVSKGLPVWDFPCEKSGTFYLSLEDTLDRLHFRLAKITDEGSEQILFATASSGLADNFHSQLEHFIETNPDTALIFIDTLQRLRNGGNASYSAEYEEIGRIKALADKYKIAIVLVHHLRKSPAGDPLDKISGSVGIAGAVDGIFILEKERRTDNRAVLYVTGRDIEDIQLNLAFDSESGVWNFVGYGDDGNTPSPVTERMTAALVMLMSGRDSWKGTSQELVTALAGIDGELDIKSNVITKLLKEVMPLLTAEHSLTIEFERTNSARYIVIMANRDSDSNILIPTGEEMEKSA